MNNQTAIATNTTSFKHFLLKYKRNKTTLILAGIAVVIQFVVFKFFYPFISYIHGDSFSYLDAADRNLDINHYLIGYSKFLRLFSVFNSTDYALAAFQYLFIQCSALYLLFTLFYFYKPGKVVQIILLCFMVLNPLFLHLSNLVSSDGFFLALSLIWFALLLWIIHRPSIKIFVWHAVVLLVAFTFRYNALIYPIIAVLAFWLSNISLKKRLLGISMVLFLCGSFISFTMYKYKKLTGYWQYSPFSGWQLANNAMYAYRYVDSAERKPVPKKFRNLDNMIREFFDSTRNTAKFLTEALKANTFYMWRRDMPLMQYKKRQFKNDTTASELKQWASMGPFYKEYGIHIIKQYPQYFIEYFIWPNASKYYAPPIEFLSSYNSGNQTVTEQAKNWFGYETRIMKTRTKNNKVLILDFYRTLSGTINVVMICCLICFFILKGWRYTPQFSYAIWLSGAVWMINALFTIGASSAALRFQSFPIVLTTVFVLLLIDWLVQVMTLMKEQEILNKSSPKEILKEHIIIQ